MSISMLALTFLTLTLFMVFSLLMGASEFLDARMDIAHGGSYVVTDVYRSYVGLLIAIGSLVALVDAVPTLMMR